MPPKALAEPGNIEGLRAVTQAGNGYRTSGNGNREPGDGMSAEKAVTAGSAADIARNWQLEGGVGFLLRLLEARYDGLYQSMTKQTDITPRQFGVLMALYQLGPLTPSVLAERISCDRNTLSEMLKRMTARRLVSKRSNPDDRRSVQVQITAKGEDALLAVIPAAAELQTIMLAPLRKEDRAHFLKCLLAIAKAPAPDAGDDT
jgi:MarR family transcriptional regulator, temperature-dependent positive regulator of motility